MKVNWTNFLLN